MIDSIIERADEKGRTCHSLEEYSHKLLNLFFMAFELKISLNNQYLRECRGKFSFLLENANLNIEEKEDYNQVAKGKWVQGNLQLRF